MALACESLLTLFVGVDEKNAIDLIRIERNIFCASELPLVAAWCTRDPTYCTVQACHGLSNKCPGNGQNDVAFPRLVPSLILIGIWTTLFASLPPWWVPLRRLARLVVQMRVVATKSSEAQPTEISRKAAPPIGTEWCGKLSLPFIMHWCEWLVVACCTK